MMRSSCWITLFGAWRVPCHMPFVLLVALLLLPSGAADAQVAAPALAPRETVAQAAGELSDGLSLTPDQRSAWGALSGEALERRAAVLSRWGVVPDSARSVPLPSEAVAELRSISAGHRESFLALLSERQRTSWLAAERRAASRLLEASSAAQASLDSLSGGPRP